MATRYAGFGMQLEYESGAGPTYTVIAGIQDVEGPNHSLDMIDANAHDNADRYKQFVPGLIDGGEVTFAVAYDPADSSQATFLTVMNSAATENYRITFPDAGDATITFAAYVTQWAPKGPVEDLLSADVTLKVNGKPVFAA